MNDPQRPGRRYPSDESRLVARLREVETLLAARMKDSPLDSLLEERLLAAGRRYEARKELIG